MRPETRRELAAALRQYRHNDGTPGFVFAYETKTVDRIIERLETQSQETEEEEHRRLFEEDVNRQLDEEQHHDQ